MWKTKRTAMTLALGMLLALLSTAFAAAPAQTSVSRTASSPPTSSQQLQAGWSGWGEVPGNGSTPSAPAATLLGIIGTTLYLFIRGTDNKIYANTFNGASWSGWSQVPGNGSTPDAPGVTQFSSKSAGQLNLFVRGTNNRIYVNILRVAS